MKKNDIALLILIVSITLVISFFIVKAVFGEPQKQATKVEKVDPISSDIVQPSKSVFNSNAINPTVVIQIGNPANQQPFNRQ
jgi:mannitol-specific phosphotransferase system IIBC component